MGEVQTWNTADSSNTDLFPEGMPFNAVNDGGRAVQGAIARWFGDSNGSVTATGSANAYAITSNRTIASLVNNTMMAWTANFTNTGAATLNLNGLGAKSIKRFNGSALASGDIISGQPVVTIYKSASDQWFMMTAPAALVTNMFADFSENATPGNPAADVVRVYARDDGSGVTELAWRDSAGTVNNLREATAADQEAATSGRFVSSRMQHRHPGHPKAGGNFDGTGTPAFRSGDYGMGAITDNGVGDYTLALDTAFANTNYWITGFARKENADRSMIFSAQSAMSKTTSAIQVMTEENGSGEAFRDSPEVGVTFWGDYA